MGAAMTGEGFPDFDVLNPRVENGTVIEASAGTGKTFSVAAFVTRALALDDDLRIGSILVTTFTRNAAAELRDRLRRRLVQVERQVRSGKCDKGDEVAVHLAGSDQERRADNLARAVREFDTATITTIHAVCARVLSMAGLPTVGESDDGDLSRVVAEVVNDAVISEALAGHFFDPARLARVVMASLSSPLSILHHEPAQKEKSGKSVEQLNSDLDRLIPVVEECVDRVRSRTRLKPTFDDMLRRTADLLRKDSSAALIASLRQRFTLAVIDEAQDTDQLQWSIFKRIFDERSPAHTLLAVGDPKQAIYRFRGADVNAYLSVRRDDRRLTLRCNWRSDADLLSALNSLFDGWSFGQGIDYVRVTPRPGAPSTSITGARPLTIIDIGATNSKTRVIKPAALRVREILESVKFVADGGQRDVAPRDICVLVNAKATGAAIEAELRSMGVSAVSSGTENVMNGEMAVALARLFGAMDHPYDSSLIRLAAATPFFGHPLASAGTLDEQTVEGVQRTIISWTSILRRRGVSALASALRADADIVSRMVRGDGGERRETDFAHVLELLHASTKGRGCSPSDVLESIEELRSREATSETVSRRVESDKDAVQIMTVHASKGLEFPIVVVADLWKKKRNADGPSIFHRPATGGPSATERVIDAGHALGCDSDAAKKARGAEEGDEVSRLFYVALTRAKHHVSLIMADTRPDRKDGPRATDGLNVAGRFPSDPGTVEVIPSSRIGSYPPYRHVATSAGALSVSAAPASTEQTYRRMSFTGIAGMRDGREGSSDDSDDRSGGGHRDDDEQVISIRSGYAGPDVDAGVPAMPLARLAGGTYFGKIIHSVYEKVDFAASDLRAEVERVVEERVGGALLRDHRDEMVDGVLLSLRTPLGGSLGATRLDSVTTSDRLSELSFEMCLADVARDSKVSDVGRVLTAALTDAGRGDDILMPYAHELSSRAFDIPLFGLMNGSIDTLIRVRGEGGGSLYITDWKSNRLDEDGAGSLIEGYGRESMLREMEHHHYPLQALIYGVAVHRYLRSRVADPSGGPIVAGLAYFFIRGMVGEATPLDAHGNRSGVFTWTAPDGLWQRLSDAVSGITR